MVPSSFLGAVVIPLVTLPAIILTVTRSFPRHPPLGNHRYPPRYQLPLVIILVIPPCYRSSVPLIVFIVTSSLPLTAIPRPLALWQAVASALHDRELKLARAHCRQLQPCAGPSSDRQIRSPAAAATPVRTPWTWCVAWRPPSGSWSRRRQSWTRLRSRIDASICLLYSLVDVIQRRAQPRSRPRCLLRFG